MSEFEKKVYDWVLYLSEKSSHTHCIYIHTRAVYIATRAVYIDTRAVYTYTQGLYI